MPLRVTVFIRVTLAFWLLFSEPVTAEIQCPAQPEQASKDAKVAVQAAIGRLGRVKAGEFSTAVERTTLDLLGKLPQADKLYFEQMLFSAFCSSVREDKQLSDSEKSRAFRDYASEVRKTLATSEARTTTSPALQGTEAASSPSQARQKKANLTGNWRTMRGTWMREAVFRPPTDYGYFIKLREIPGGKVLGSIETIDNEGRRTGNIYGFTDGRIEDNHITLTFFGSTVRSSDGTTVKEMLYGEVFDNGLIHFTHQVEGSPPTEFSAQRAFCC